MSAKKSCLVISLVVLGFAIWTFGQQLQRSKLRSQVYEPLGYELSRIETAVQDASQLPDSAVQHVLELTAKPEFGHLPPELQQQILGISSDAAAYEKTVAELRALTNQRVHDRILKLRGPAIDKAWREETLHALRKAQDSGEGPLRTSMAEHTARLVAWNLRDPDHPEIVEPGGPIWSLGDWLNYPASFFKIELGWSDVDYLYFDDDKDCWDWRLTREDLYRARLTLTDILDPIYQKASATSQFKHFPEQRAELLNSVRVLKSSISPFVEVRKAANSVQKEAVHTLPEVIVVRQPSE
jgi:hypothetical protein